MITVEAAEKIIQAEIHDFGNEVVTYETALGRILAEDLLADRDLPPFNRATVDGIAIRFSAFEKGQKSFPIMGIQGAGMTPIPIHENNCIEIMTGCAVDTTSDTIIRYEDIVIENGVANIKAAIKKGQNIHQKGKDKRKGEILVPKNQRITPAILGIAASVGKTKLLVQKLPKIAIITTGDEMVPAEETPNDFQLRRSNGVTISAALEKYKIEAENFHLNDEENILREKLEEIISNYDVLLLTGGVSMGKFDFIPKILLELGVEKKFHKIKQRPGKPFWFGVFENKKFIFAFPGNPVSVFLCLHRYFFPWLEGCLGLKNESKNLAVLKDDLNFPIALHYFAQVKTTVDENGQLVAEIFETNGSGDFSHLAEANAFMEFPMEKDAFKSGEIYPIWFFNPNF